MGYLAQTGGTWKSRPYASQLFGVLRHLFMHLRHLGGSFGAFTVHLRPGFAMVIHCGKLCAVPHLVLLVGCTHLDVVVCVCFKLRGFTAVISSQLQMIVVSLRGLDEALDFSLGKFLCRLGGLRNGTHCSQYKRGSKHNTH